MDALTRLDRLAILIGLALLSWHLTGIAAHAWRHHSSGATGTAVAAGITAALLGTAAAILGAFLGGLAALGAARAMAGTMPAVLVQLAAAMACSWLVAHLYRRWLARPVRAWFAGEEGPGRG